MAKSPGLVRTQLRQRAPAGAAVVSAPAASAPKRPINPARFLREVRAEARKVTWTSWKETWITSVMVGIMVVLTALFFFGVDWVLNMGVAFFLKLANAE
jgi:preprotein translocase subunit SecE